MKHDIVTLLSSDDILSLRSDWPNLNSFERADRLRSLRPGYSIRDLAHAVGCSPKTVRNLLILATVPKSDRSKPGRPGTKKILAATRARHKTFRHWRKLMATPAGRKIEAKLTRALHKWFVENMPPCFWDAFCDEVLTCAATKQQFRRALPSWTECQIEGDWKVIIAATRPTRDPDSLIYDSLFGYWVEWLAAWLPRCMPVGHVAQRVFLRVREQLRRDARKLGGEAWLV